MKCSIILSVAITTLALMANADATDIYPVGDPKLPSTYTDCMAKPQGGASWETLCSDLHSCEEYHSTVKGTWDECVAKAQGDYLKAVTPGGIPEDEAIVGEELDVRTKAADSDYWIKGDGHKGFLESDQD